MTAEEVNQLYINAMLDELGDGLVLKRIRDFWWAHFIEAFDQDPDYAIDNLDLWMDKGQIQLREAAITHALAKGFEKDTEGYVQRISQVLKSSTGKMFERFIGLSISYYLLSKKAPYAVWPFRKDIEKVSSWINLDAFKININLGEVNYKTNVDADLLIFKPDDSRDPFFMVSVKSTLKDRFHNVPFWNLLRISAMEGRGNASIVGENSLLTKAKYISVCTDLAKEQPDFSAVKGPRNLLCIDAALLDGAYVTCSKAKGLGSSDNHFGPNRDKPFYPLSKLMNMLLSEV